MSLRVVYMGTPDFAVPPLAALLASHHHVVGIFTQPDRPSGRGKKLAPPPVKVLAAAHNVPVMQPERLRKSEDAYAQMVAWKPDIAVVAAYGQILPQRFLDVPRLGCINIHGSILPAYRGASPIQASVLNGDAETGVTIMQMEAGLDTGPMLEMRSIAIGDRDTSQTMHDKLSQLGAGMIVGVLDALEAGTLEAIAQDDTLATYAPLMKKEDGILDLSAPAKNVVSRIHGLNPWPGAQTTLNQPGKEPLAIKFLLAQTAESTGPHKPGTVLEHGKRLIIACGEGAIEVLELQPTGKRPMAARDFLNGVRLADSDTFG